MSESKNRFLLRDFTDYCIQHPEQKFWEALRDWSESDQLIVGRFPRRPFVEGRQITLHDTFYWERKNG